MIEAERLEALPSGKRFEAVIGQFGPVGEELFQLIELRQRLRRFRHSVAPFRG